MKFANGGNLALVENTLRNYLGLCFICGVIVLYIKCSMSAGFQCINVFDWSSFSEVFLILYLPDGCGRLRSSIVGILDKVLRIT